MIPSNSSYHNLDLNLCKDLEIPGFNLLLNDDSPRSNTARQFQTSENKPFTLQNSTTIFADIPSKGNNIPRPNTTFNCQPPPTQKLEIHSGSSSLEHTPKHNRLDHFGGWEEFNKSTNNYRQLVNKVIHEDNTQQKYFDISPKMFDQTAAPKNCIENNMRLHDGREANFVNEAYSPTNQKAAIQISSLSQLGGTHQYGMSPKHQVFSKDFNPKQILHDVRHAIQEVQHIPSHHYIDNLYPMNTTVIFFVNFEKNRKMLSKFEIVLMLIKISQFL